MDPSRLVGRALFHRSCLGRDPHAFGIISATKRAERSVSPTRSPRVEREEAHSFFGRGRRRGDATHARTTFSSLTPPEAAKKTATSNDSSLIRRHPTGGTNTNSELRLVSVKRPPTLGPAESAKPVTGLLCCSRIGLPIRSRHCRERDSKGKNLPIHFEKQGVVVEPS